MHLTIVSLSGEAVTVDVSEELELENLVALCGDEIHVGNGLAFLLNGSPLTDMKRTLREVGVKANDVLYLRNLSHPDPVRAQPTGSSSAGGASNPFAGIDFSQLRTSRTGPEQSRRSLPSARDMNDPNTVRNMFLSDPHALALLRDRNPALAEALESGNTERFSTVLRSQVAERQEEERKRVQAMFADPFDPVAQQYIEKAIQEENINSMLEHAVEHAPEVFGYVTMLYINCTVNGHHVKAFVDSGAQSTIMSAGCASRCNIMRLVDRRFAGIARGVGTQKIIGKIHLAQLQIEGAFLPTSFVVLEDQNVDMLLGLDMLKRHQCIIDLQKNVLRIGTTGTETTFLPESELPASARHDGAEDPIDEDRQLAEAMQRSSAESASASGSASSSLSTSVAQPPEDRIKKLIEMGFAREQAIAALQKNGGDVGQAAMSLFAASLPKGTPGKR